jgi:crotonobetainyl-CoA:carnitine CoA-transferase CaiB-like acyl-CoA transferase
VTQDVRLPLEGLTVLDLSRVLAGPYASQLLGDLGADVWKIEYPVIGDETRGWGPPFAAGESAYFLSINRNKRSVALDLGEPRARDAVLAAARSADVVIENFLPGRLTRFGLDPAALRAVNPSLVVCSITGFGQTGPYVALPGYDAVLQGFTGLMSITGEPDRPPVKVGVATIDVLAGCHAASAILAALVGRLRGGGGAHLDVALAEVGIAGLVNVAQAALATGEPARRHGTAHPTIVPYQTFDTADRPIVVAVGNDGQWERLCRALGRPEWWARQEWRRNRDRVLHRADVVAALTERLAGGSQRDWLATLSRAGVPAGPVRDVGEVVNDPALRVRDFVRDTRLTGEERSIPLLTLPWCIDGVRPRIRLSPPRLGEHTQQFLERFGS